MLYTIGRVLSILLLIAINVGIDILWFKVSAILGVLVLLAAAFFIYKVVVFAQKEKKVNAAPEYEILSNLN
jgi:hypothetical protein